MVKDSIIVGILIAVVGGLLLLILGIPITDILNPPQAVPTAQENEKFCPTTLSFSSYGDKQGSFSVEFQNLGDDGTLFVTLFSDKILIRTDNSKQFSNNDTKYWIVNSKKYQDFNFEIKKNENITLIENFTISLDYGCYEEVLGRNFNCEQYRKCCNYQKEQYSSDSYILVNDAC